MTRVKIHKQVSLWEPEERTPTDWNLFFQWVTYNHDDGEVERGYRFIWCRPDGTLQAARGQARIPSAEALFILTSKASKAGWFVSIESVKTP